MVILAAMKTQEASFQCVTWIWRGRSCLEIGVEFYNFFSSILYSRKDQNNSIELILLLWNKWHFKMFILGNKSVICTNDLWNINLIYWKKLEDITFESCEKLFFPTSLLETVIEIYLRKKNPNFPKPIHENVWIVKTILYCIALYCTVLWPSEQTNTINKTHESIVHLTSPDESCIMLFHEKTEDIKI
jgi:hypothetical protein